MVLFFRRLYGLRAEEAAGPVAVVGPPGAGKTAAGVEAQ
jgi:KaiC/GvpD/RAD55 family RecA-like ATPase